jgi:hypothetical protein
LVTRSSVKLVKIIFISDSHTNNLIIQYIPRVSSARSSPFEEQVKQAKSFVRVRGTIPNEAILGYHNNKLPSINTLYKM